MTIVTLLTAHPEERSFTHALAAAWRTGAERAGATVEAFEVTRLAFDPVLRHGYRQPMEDEPDLARVRASIGRAAYVGWFFPTWWAAPPAALKGLVDRLFLPGLSFRYDGGPLPKGLMAGRGARYVSSMDSPAAWYWLAHRDALGSAFGRGTLKFVGFGPVERTLIYSARRLGEGGRARWLARVEAQGFADARRAGAAVLAPGLTSA